MMDVRVDSVGFRTVRGAGHKRERSTCSDFGDVDWRCLFPRPREGVVTVGVPPQHRVQRGFMKSEADGSVGGRFHGRVCDGEGMCLKPSVQVRAFSLATEVSSRQRRSELSDLAATFVKGGTSGALSAVCLQPLDVIKTRVQGVHMFKLHSTKFSSSSSSTASAAKHQQRVLVRQAVVEVWRQDGVAGFWRGIAPTMFRSSLGPGIYFLILETMQAHRREQNSTGKKSVFSDDKKRVFLEGAMSRGIAGTLLCPLSVVKTRIEWSRGRAGAGPSTFSMLARIAREERLRGLFRGVVPTLVRDVPSSGLYLVLYQSVLKPWSRRTFSDCLSIPVLNMSSAVGAGVISAMVTQPMDSLKTQMQLNNAGILESCRALYRARGMWGFYYGVSTRIIRRPLTMAITWTAYEVLVDRPMAQ